MKANTRSTIKLISGTVLFIGLVFGFIDRYYAPTAIVTENSTILPAWMGWIGWILPSAAAVVYVLMDFLEWLRRRRR